MDRTERKISKLARDASSFTLSALKDTGLGPSEYDFIHCVRRHPGINQESVREKLSLDKAAAARRAANLEKKGYITRVQDDLDHRVKRLYATEKAEHIKKSKVSVESLFYEWLLEDVDEIEADTFIRVLRHVYQKSKNERKHGFQNLLQLEEERSG